MALQNLSEVCNVVELEQLESSLAPLRRSSKKMQMPAFAFLKHVEYHVHVIFPKPGQRNDASNCIVLVHFRRQSFSFLLVLLSAP